MIASGRTLGCLRTYSHPGIASILGEKTLTTANTCLLGKLCHYIIGYMLLVCTSSPTNAQVYNVTTYTPSDGLIQSQVRAILQDHQRFLWLGTHGGVNRYDGKLFNNYTPADSLLSDFVTCLFQDSQHNIWIGTEQGVSRFDGKSYENYRRDSGLESDYVNTIIEDDQGRIWLGTKEGISVMDSGKWKSDLLRWGDSVVLREVNTLWKDRDNKIWIGTAKGLFYAQEDKLYRMTIPGMPFSASVLSLYENPQGELWIGTERGLYKWDGLTLRMYSRQTGELPHNTIYCLEEDNDQQLWIGTGNGVVRYADERFIAMPESDDTRRYIIRAITADVEGNIWLGTDGGGLQKVIKGVFRSFNVSDGMNSNIAKSFLEDESGRIWISTFDQGVDVYQAGRFIYHYGEEEGLGGNDISFSLKDHEQNFWFATYSSGVSKMENGSFTVFDITDGLLSNRVFSLAEIGEDEIWLGTDLGISIMKNDKIIGAYSAKDGLPSNSIYTICEDRRGNVWVGTAEGVARIRKGNITTYAEGYIPYAVLSILEDNWGRIWFATSNGLYFFDQGEFIFVQISGAPGAHNVVSLVSEDGKYLWIGTENGAYRLDLTDFRPDRKYQYEHYTQKDGFPSMECNANASFYDSNGNIWIGTVNGAVMHPEGAERSREDVRPVVHITGVRLGLEETDWDALGYQTTPYSKIPLDLKLAHSDNRLAFDFVGISLKSPQQLEYKYKLEGLDKEWSPSTRQTSASYSNLASGTYTFMAVSKSEADLWNYNSPASFTFTIRPAYYETLWFWSIVGLLMGFIGWSIYKYQRTERRRKAEEARIKNQAEKLQLEHQALYAMMNPHFTFNALQSIQYFIHRQDKIAANKFLSSFAKLIRKNLESTKSEFISLQEEVDRLRLYLDLEQMRFPEKFTYDLYVDPSLDSQSVLIPPMILQPFVENSIKHGIMSLEEDGKIEINIVRLEEEYMLVEVIDNGIGIESSKKRRENRPSGHVSKGMQITKDRLALFSRMTGKKYSLNIGEIQNSDHIAGTKVSIVLPIHRDLEVISFISP